MKSERPENDEDAAVGRAAGPADDTTRSEREGTGPLSEPASTAPAAAPGDAREPNPDATAEPAAEPDTAPTSEEGLASSAPPAPTATSAPDATPAPERAATPDATPEPGPAAAPDKALNSQRAAASDPAPDSDRAAAPDPAPESQPAAAPDPAPESQPAAAPDPAPESQPAAVPETVSESREAAAPEPEPGSSRAPGADAGSGSRQIAGDGPETEPGQAPGRDADAAEVAALSGVPGEAGRAARRRSLVAVASVAAAVLLVGGGGAYLAATGGSGGSGGSGGNGAGTGAGAPGGGTPPPLALDGYSSGGKGIAPGEPNPYGVTYRADGTLPAGPASAAVYQPAGEVSKARVAALAQALGIEGAPVAEGRVWKVGTDSDGSGGSLQVNRDAPGIWTYSRYAPGTDNCKRGPVCGRDPAAPAATPVSASAAEKAAAPVLDALGQDGAKLDASQVMGDRRAVNANPVVDGLPTYGWTTGLTVDKQGEVVGGNGMLAVAAKGATYPVLSARRTLDLMNAAPRSDHRMGIGGCASSVPLKDRLEQPCSASSPSAGAAVIRGAVFGLAAHSVGGRQALVPSWLFQVRGAADSYTVTYPAVDPKYLAAAASPTPASSPGTPKDVRLDGYTADGGGLTVAFTGGVCADYEATADEGARQVVVKVTETPWPDKVCILIAKQYHRTVRLDAPLDGRKVVGTDGRAVPKEKATALDPQVG
ncbi:hypothetical protein [Streptomyces sp. NPDC093970]|uniref:hypothetical protein n=1 Tax=Streptomyces sp. NPDC093970 TaxID=3155076 RepID=UPI00343DE2B8